jgi:hypothetical protein
VIDVVLFSLNGIDWRSIDKYMIVSQRSKSMVQQNLTTIDYGITNKVDRPIIISLRNMRSYSTIWSTRLLISSV